jgi:hypothetical protein
LTKRKRLSRVEKIVVRVVAGSQKEDVEAGGKDVIKTASKISSARIRRMIADILSNPRLSKSELDDVRLKLLDIHGELDKKEKFRSINDMLDYFEKLFRLTEEIGWLLEEDYSDDELLRMADTLQKFVRGKPN